MRRLGYERYGAHGNDAGSLISPEVGPCDPEHVVGVHVTQLFSFPSGDPAEFEDLTAEDQAGWSSCSGSRDDNVGSTRCSRTQPQTLAYALRLAVRPLGWSRRSSSGSASTPTTS